MAKSTKIYTFLAFLLLVLPALAVSECTCDKEDEVHDKAEALEYKTAALASILFASAIGVLIPVLGKFTPALSPEKDIFFMIRAFAAGVILSTGFTHVFPDAFESLTSPCLSEHPWGDFPFTGFVSMCAAMGTLMVDAFATAYFKRLNMKNGHIEADGDEEKSAGTRGQDHDHSHGLSDSSSSSHQLLRQRVISQVLEMGIIVHSVIIGISLGASRGAQVIKPLVAALTFHQFFEGMGLGSCITQAKFKNKTIATMVLFFALTTPMGIAIGIGIANVYDENSQNALIVEGIFNAASAGILIYMALVDFLAADFMSDRMQNSSHLQFGANICVLLGAGLMSLLAKWA
ncbi:zinc transporter 5-like [Prosopis cineraria]|uniref:zinc transporter 5-like n=1 Tax=Prosopis cineraria TaxID=364024 RepID=UPI0024109F2C|nr:zinc transporter 5-like [Prosopis cineraria]